ncbi:phosphomannomutase [Marinomonas sp. 2405UD68-3]|uniref:phosphomannomutase n=1 Tax=Marinomonas sp. 2405UD68-3 TaxID=3391835 RepID=UPI0039C9B409
MISRIIKESGISFGTSGARGLNTQFTEDVCAAFSVSFVNAMRQEYSFKKVALAMDRRPSSLFMAQACAGALSALGYDVLFYGVLPTPALALQAMSDEMPAIMITGSHIPFDRNGIKFYRPDGEITKADELLILSDATTLPAFSAIKLNELSLAKENYVNRYITAFSNTLFKGFKIGIYEHSAAGRDLNREVFESLGATVISLGRSDSFVPIDTEAVSDIDKKKALDWIQTHQLDAVFSTDGDGDRPLLSDENGVWLKGDVLGILCAQAVLARVVSLPINSNTSVDSVGFEKIERTRIGSPYVIAGMESLAQGYASVAGFEANGGFLCGEGLYLGGNPLAALPTRDAILPALAVLAKSRLEKVSVSSLVSKLLTRHTASDRLQNIDVNRMNNLLKKWFSDPSLAFTDLHLASELQESNSLDGLRLTLKNADVVHIRPSGNAPELRCYVESDSPEKAENLMRDVLGKLSQWCSLNL